MRRHFRLIALFALSAFHILTAQEGNRANHHSLAPVVPEELIPPAPVLSVEEALKAFTLAEGFIIEPVAFEPLVEKPIALKFDGNGRIWVVEMRGYMTDLEDSERNIPQGRVVVLEDTDNDGHADKRTIFLDKILLPRAIALVKDGILIGDHTQLYFCGRDGTQRTSEPTVVDHAFSPSGNVEHKPNTLLPHLNNWLYCAKSRHRYRWQDGQLHKDTTEARGQWGLTMDNFGRLYHNSNSTVLKGDRLLPDVLESFPKAKLKPITSVELGTNRIHPIRVTPGVNRAYIAIANGYDKNTLDPKTHKLINTTASCGPDYYRGDQFPEEWQDVVFSCESVAQLIKATRITSNGLNITGQHVFSDKEFLASTDERFRPVNAHTAPDGSLYLVDYYHGLIQHKTYITSYLRDQYESRDLQTPPYELGRIYRIRHKDTPLGEQPKLLESSSEELLKTLSHPNGWWRDTAQRLLIESNSPQIIQPLRKLLQNHENEITRIHAFWTLDGLNALTESDYIHIFDSEAPLNLRTNALASLAKSELIKKESLRNVIQNSQMIEAHTIPYAIRLLTSVANDSSILSKLPLDTPFAPHAAATGLLSQGITKAPKTRTKLDHYLANFAKSQKATPPEERLSGHHLASFLRGKDLYSKAACISCHGPDGLGLPNLGPPLDKSEWVTGSASRFAKILLHGLQGPIMVDGTRYTPAAAMPGLAQNPSISNQDLADVMTYVRGNWSNQASFVSEALVKKVRGDTKSRSGRLYTVDEL